MLVSSQVTLNRRASSWLDSAAVHLREWGGGDNGQRELHKIIIIKNYQCFPEYLVLASWEETLLELGGLWVMEQGGELWMLEQGLAELTAEGLHPVEQSAPLDMPQTFCTEMLKFLPAMPEAHPGCTLLVSNNYLNNNYLNNNQKKL